MPCETQKSLPNQAITELPQHHGMSRSHFLEASFLPLPSLLTISGAAIIKGRSNFLFHYKSKCDASRLVHPGNTPTESLSLVDSIITANGITAGVRVT